MFFLVNPKEKNTALYRNFLRKKLVNLYKKSLRKKMQIYIGNT